MRLLKTREVMRLLNVASWVIYGMLAEGKLPPPAKDASGDLIWGPKDVAALRAALARPRSKGGRPRVA
jgi:predicted DNA-binding transcriptional regulator AlpA